MPDAEILDLQQLAIRADNQREVHNTNGPSPEMVLRVLLDDHSVQEFFGYRGQTNFEELRRDVEFLIRQAKKAMRFSFFQSVHPLDFEGVNILKDAQQLTTRYQVYEERKGVSPALITLYSLMTIGAGSEAAKFLQENYGLTADAVQNFIQNPPGGKRILATMANNDSQKPQQSFLEYFTTNLSEEVKQEGSIPTIGRDTEISSLAASLGQKSKNSVLLVGDPGIGREAIVRGLAQRRKDLSVIQINVPQLLSGTRSTADITARIQAILKELKDVQNPVLFVEGLEKYLETNPRMQQLNAMPETMLSALMDSPYPCISSITQKSYKANIHEKKFDGFFDVQRINEPSLKEAEDIVLKTIGSYADFHGIPATEESVKAAVKLSGRYMSRVTQPQTTIDIMDAAFSAVKTGVIESSDTIDGTQHPKIVTTDVVEQIVAEKSGMPLAQVKGDDDEKFLKLEGHLQKHIVGQDEAITAISQKCREARAGLSDDNKPQGSYVFRGPTGVGKTEVAKQLAEVLGYNFVRIDMSEYMEKHAATRLIGAPPGYLGFDQGGVLTEAVDEHPYSVVLFDEAEKAHPDVYNILLQVLDAGVLTDGQGRAVNFRNTLIILSSNIGQNGELQNAIGFGRDEVTSTADGDYERFFTPEFRNRLDGDIEFNEIKKADVPFIIAKRVELLSAALREKNMSITFDDTATKWIAEHGFNKEMGARPLGRAINDNVKPPISSYILKHKGKPPKTNWTVSSDGNVLKVEFDQVQDGKKSLIVPERPKLIMPSKPKQAM